VISVYLYYFLAAISCWFGIQSLLSGIRYAAYVRRETSRELPDFHPFASVIVPGGGLEPGLAENLRPLLEQDYPRYEVLFVFDRENDPAAGLVKHGSSRISRTIIAGPATDSGQKVHNLRVAVTRIDPKSEVLVFVDTDARPASDWLRKLVAPLADETVGATTGYRWFIPERGGISSRLRGVWNASVASALGSDRAKNFCWGGSTAIRRATFYKPDISILDLHMPPQKHSPASGLQLLKYIKGHLPQSRVLIMSSNSEIEVRKACVAAGADGFFAKPFELEDMLASICKLTPVHRLELFAHIL